MRVRFPREGVLAALRERAGGAAFVLAGPPGAGKTTMLLALQRRLDNEGWCPLYLDLMGAASSPERFVDAATAALPERLGSRAAARREEAAGLAAAHGRGSAAVVQALFATWAALDEVDGRPVALLVDEATEIRALAYFAGLREVDAPFGAALASRRRGTVLATSFPSLAHARWPALGIVPLPPITGDELRPVLRALGMRSDPDALARAGFGWPGSLRALVEAVLAGSDPTSAWVQEMSPGGAIESACRHTYEVLLLRSRGYGMSKAVLAAVAEEEGLNLTALVTRLGRTPGAIRDYLGWLLAVDALRTVKKRYYYVDGLLRCWVALYTRGVRPREEEIEAAARQAIAIPPAAAVSPPATLDPTLALTVAPVRDEGLMEID